MPSVDNLPSTKHQDIIKRFRKNIESITTREYSDEYLLRILRARNFNLQKAKELFSFVFRIKQTYQVDTLTETYQKHEPMKKCEFGGYMGLDKTGSPIQYIGLGNADFEGFLRSADTFKIFLYCTYCIEKLLKHQKENDDKEGRQREGSISAIFDFENFSLQQIMMRPIIETGLDLMKQYQEGYPGFTDRIYIINVPSYFSIVFNIFKPILKLDILEKITICSKENTPSELLKYIDADVLPAFLGGNRVDENGDPRCSSFINPGCKVPEELYGIYKEFLNLTDHGVSEVTIPARTSLDLEFEVFEPKSKFHVEMWSDNTFGMHIFYRNNSKSNKQCMENSYNGRSCSTEEIISPYAKIQSHLVPVDTEVLCFRAGTYIFRLDNSYSWLSSKRVVYRITIIPPSSDSPLKDEIISSN